MTHAIPPAHRLAVAYDAEGWPWRIDVRPPDRRRVFLGLGPLAAPLPAVHLNAVASLPVYFAEHPDHLALAGLAAGLVLVTDPPSYDGGRQHMIHHARRRLAPTTYRRTRPSRESGASVPHPIQHGEIYPSWVRAGARAPRTRGGLNHGDQVIPREPRRATFHTDTIAALISIPVRHTREEDPDDRPRPHPDRPRAGRRDPRRLGHRLAAWPRLGTRRRGGRRVRPG